MIFWILFLSCVFYHQVPFGHAGTTVATIPTPPAAEVKSTMADEPELNLLDYDVWCKLQPNANDCSEKGHEITRYYYDTKLEGCKTFQYKECVMSYNSFDTMTECSEACRESGLHPIKSHYSYKIFCRLQPDFGQCHEYQPISERESYGDSAVGYVQVKRDGNICVVKARITPEHNVRQKCYAVEAVCDEAEEPHNLTPLFTSIRISWHRKKHFIRFYFDINTRRCKGFSYSGCGGNNNRFPTTQVCAEMCLKLMDSELHIV